MLTRNRKESPFAAAGDNKEEDPFASLGPDNENDEEEDYKNVGWGEDEMVGTMVGTETQKGVKGFARGQGTKSSLVAAIDRLLSVTTVPLAEEIEWQVGPETTKDEIAGQMDLKVFMILRPGSKDRTVSLVHSIAQCFATGQAHGKYVGFVGDATDVGVTLAAVELQQNKTWDTPKQVISTNLEEYTTACEGDPELKKKKWTATVTTNEVASTPRLLHVPLILARHMLMEGKRYTPYDVLHIISTHFSDDAGVVGRHWYPITTWCLFAAQNDAIQLDVIAVIEMEREFARWTATRLHTTLGYTQGQQQEVQVQQGISPGNPNAALAEAVSRGVARVMMQQGGPGGVKHTQLYGGQASSESDTKNDYDNDDKALLMGFSMVDMFAHVSSFWNRIRGKRPDVARRILMEQMEEASYSQRVVIEQTLYIDERNMKDIQKLRFNPGATAQFSTANEGLTPLLCRSRSPREQEYLTRREAAMEETYRTRTLDDAMAKPKYDPRFPENFHEMRIMLDTFMIMCLVMFGNRSPLYDQLRQVSVLLSSRQVQLQAMAYKRPFWFKETVLV